MSHQQETDAATASEGAILPGCAILHSGTRDDPGRVRAGERSDGLHPATAVEELE